MCIVAQVVYSLLISIYIIIVFTSLKYKLCINAINFLINIEANFALIIF